MTTADVDPSTTQRSTAALDRFESRIRALWTRDRFDLPDCPGQARLIRLLLEMEGTGSPSAARILADSGIRARWNTVFAEDRSATLAQWLGPELSTPWLDLLAGDFTLTRALAQTGNPPAVAVERRCAYPTDWAVQPFPVRDLAELPALRREPFGAALVCTVLHHEPDPATLLEALGELDCARWVVVENCLDEDNDEAFHLLVDEFFNGCLNSFDVPCVPQHRVAAEWVGMLSRYGEVRSCGRRQDVPGIPFPYEAFVVERVAR
jgi:hypothetical protein